MIFLMKIGGTACPLPDLGQTEECREKFMVRYTISWHQSYRLWLFYFINSFYAAYLSNVIAVLLKQFRGLINGATCTCNDSVILINKCLKIACGCGHPSILNLRINNYYYWHNFIAKTVVTMVIKKWNIKTVKRHAVMTATWRKSE